MTQPSSDLDSTFLVALSLLPSLRWPRVFDALRHGAGPARTLEEILGRHYRDRPGHREELLALAKAGLALLRAVQDAALEAHLTGLDLA